MMRADRLISILLLLQSRGKVTTRELAELLEVSERTVARDMESLSASGVPILAERGRDGGWRLPEGYRTTLTGMKPVEIGSLLLSADTSVLEALGIKEQFASAVRKLEAAYRWSGSPLQMLSQRVHIDGAAWHPSEESFPFLSLIQQAVWEERTVRIMYPAGEEQRSRIISPLGLVAKRGVWYTVADCGGELRTFRISRIAGAEWTGTGFTRPEGFDLAAYWEASTAAFQAALPRYSARLKLRPEAAQPLARERYVKLLRCGPIPGSDWLEAEAEFNTLESACRIILSYGRDVMVLAPEELRSNVRSVLIETLKLYP